MLPRYALGNWWSRYYAYTEDSYKELVTRFEKEEIPFSVGVIDMDWHLVEDVNPKYGSGWTGYTWNKNYFPDPKRFMTWLHDHGMRITLNLHPADGIRASEEAYPKIAEELGNVDTANEAPLISPVENSWKLISSVCFTRKKRRVWTSGGLTGSREIQPRYRDWIRCGC